MLLRKDLCPFAARLGLGDIFFVHDSLVFLENIARELLWAIIPFDRSSPPPFHSESNPPNKTDTSRANNAVDATKPQIIGEEDDTVMNAGTESCCFGNSDSMKIRKAN